MQHNVASLLLASVLLTGCIAGAPPASEHRAALRAGPPSQRAMRFMPGLWQARIDNNGYLMRVSWNANASRFEGRLAGQGNVSQYVGFDMGELVWIAQPTENPDVFIENQKWRWGSHGMSTGSKWMEGSFDYRNSGPTDLVTSFANFRKVAN